VKVFIRDGPDGGSATASYKAQFLWKMVARRKAQSEAASCSSDSRTRRSARSEPRPRFDEWLSGWRSPPLRVGRRVNHDPAWAAPCPGRETEAELQLTVRPDARTPSGSSGDRESASDLGRARASSGSGIPAPRSTTVQPLFVIPETRAPTTMSRESRSPLDPSESGRRPTR